MARINRRPSANRRSTLTEDPPFNPNLEPGMPGFGAVPPGAFALFRSLFGGAPPPSGGPPTSFAPTPSFGTTAFRSAGSAPTGGSDTGSAIVAALSKPGALSPTRIPSGVAGVRTSFMRGPGGGGHFGGPFGSLGGL